MYIKGYYSLPEDLESGITNFTLQINVYIKVPANNFTSFYHFLEENTHMYLQYIHVANGLKLF